MLVDFQSMAGPGDKSLPNSEIEGYQPVSRIGEVVMNAFVDAYEFTSEATKDQISLADLNPLKQEAADRANIVEYKPHFHEWATVREGMICLARKKRTAVFRQYVAAETAVPVIACAAGLKTESEKDYFFAGVARTKSLRTPDDGIGPTTDEARRANCNFRAFLTRRLTARFRLRSFSPSPLAAWSRSSTPRGSPSTRATSLSGACGTTRPTMGSVRSRALAGWPSPLRASRLRRSLAAPSALQSRARALTSFSSSRCLRSKPEGLKGAVGRSVQI